MARAALHGCSCVPARRSGRTPHRLEWMGGLSGRGGRRDNHGPSRKGRAPRCAEPPGPSEQGVGGELVTDGVVLAAGSRAYEYVSLLPKARAWHPRTHSSASLLFSRPKRSTASRCHLDSIVHALAPKSLLVLRAPKAGSESDRADQALTCRSPCPLRLPLSFSRAYLAWLR